MIMARKFKTARGCAKRCRTETALCTTHTFTPVRYWEGKVDKGPIDPMRLDRYTWGIRKELRQKPVTLPIDPSSSILSPGGRALARAGLSML